MERTADSNAKHSICVLGTGSNHDELQNPGSASPLLLVRASGGETGVGAEESRAPLANAMGHLKDDAGGGGGWPGTLTQGPSYTQHPQATAGHVGKTITVKKHQFYVGSTWYLLYDFIIL